MGSYEKRFLAGGRGGGGRLIASEKLMTVDGGKHGEFRVTDVLTGSKATRLVLQAQRLAGYN